MNYYEIQKRVLDDLEAGRVFSYAETGDSIVFTTNNHVCYCMSKEFLFLNIEKTDSKYCSLLLTVLENAEKAEVATMTSELYRLHDNRLCIKIKNTKTEAWANVELFELFGSSCQYCITSEREPIYVYKHDMLVGAVCSIRISHPEET